MVVGAAREVSRCPGVIGIDCRSSRTSRTAVAVTAGLDRWLALVRRHWRGGGEAADVAERDLFAE